MREPQTDAAEKPHDIAAKFGCGDKAESGAQNDFVFASLVLTNAQVAELADALDSGSSAWYRVAGRILSGSYEDRLISQPGVLMCSEEPRVRPRSPPPIL